jgi:hypothetical protein
MYAPRLKWKHTRGKITAKICRSNKNKMDATSGLKEAYTRENNPKF